MRLAHILLVCCMRRQGHVRRFLCSPSSFLPPLNRPLVDRCVCVCVRGRRIPRLPIQEYLPTTLYSSASRWSPRRHRIRPMTTPMCHTSRMSTSLALSPLLPRSRRRRMVLHSRAHARITGSGLQGSPPGTGGSSRCWGSMPMCKRAEFFCFRWVFSEKN